MTHPSAPFKLKTPAGEAHIVIGSLVEGKARYQVDGEPVELDVTIPDDLAKDWFWSGACLCLSLPPSVCGLSICANTYPPPRCFDMAREWMRREHVADVVQERMF